MKRLLHLFATAALLLCGSAIADDEAEEKELALVPQALSEVKLVNKAKPNLDAKIYFVYQSRSTCGICVAEAPALVKEYKRMKRQGCEMVMLNVDHSADAAEKWVKKEKMDFPVVHPSQSMSTGIPWEYTGRGLLPCMIAMTADGTKLGEAGGKDVEAFVKSWRKMLNELKREEAKKAAAEKKEKSKKADKKSSKKKNKKRKKNRDDEDEEDDDASFDED